MDPFLSVDPAKTTSFATLTGPLAVLLLGFAVDHRILPVFESIATHPPVVVVVFNGARVKFLAPEFAILV